MAQVSNESELRAALSSADTTIQITADIRVAAQLSINYPVTISSVSPGVFTIRKGSSFAGSLFRVQNDGALVLQNLILDGQEAGSYLSNEANRSLILVAGGSLRLQNGVVLQNNSSYQEGGGVYLSGNTAYTNSLIMEGNAQIVGCESRTSGGGLMVAFRNSNDTVNLSGQLLFKGNRASDGGGIYIRSYVEGVGGTVTLADNILVTENTVVRTGGGVYISGYRTGNSDPVSLAIGGNASIDNNDATHGGGIYFYSANPGDQLELGGAAQVKNNHASGNGGGINLTVSSGKAAFKLEGATINSNTAGVGGGIYLLTSSGGSVLASQAKITDNEAVSGDGGGIWIQNNSETESLSISFRGLTVSQNQASAQGGGIVFNGGSAPCVLDINDNSIFSGNRAGTNGGGLLFGNGGGAHVNLAQSQITENTAGGYGGGFYFSNAAGTPSSIIQMDTVTVKNNIAGAEGGGLRLSSGSGDLESTLRNCSITENIARNSSGGGIWNGGTKDILKVEGSTEITVNRSEEGNGGGIYFNSDNGSLLLKDDVKITYNQADTRSSLSGNHGGGIYAVPGEITIEDDAEIAFNSALKYGGGLGAAEFSTVRMDGGNIHDNQSSQYGGGIWNHGGSSFTLTGGVISDNTAQIGGGLYNDDGSTATISGSGQLSGNNASVSAPGIYNSGTFYTEGERDLVNGIYLKNRGAVIFLQNPILAGSVIQLDRSEYVTPNETGTPIVVGEATSEYPRLQQTDADGLRKPSQGFDGWEIRLSDDSTQILLAPLTYTIQYEELRGASHSNPGIYTVTTPEIRLTAPSPILGYRFVGWFDALAGGEQVTVIPKGSTGDLVLYARWEAVYYIITYYGNNAGDEPWVQWVPAPILVQEGMDVTLSQVIPRRMGYQFIQWNTDPAGQGRDYQPGGQIQAIDSDLDLYAQWEE